MHGLPFDAIDFDSIPLLLDEDAEPLSAPRRVERSRSRAGPVGMAIKIDDDLETWTTMTA